MRIFVQYNRATVVTKSDTVDFSDPPLTGPSGKLADGLYIGGTGDVVVVVEDGTAITFKAVPVGTILPMRCRRVNSTSTTATSMLALYVM